MDHNSTTQVQYKSTRTVHNTYPRYNSQNQTQRKSRIKVGSTGREHKAGILTMRLGDEVLCSKYLVMSRCKGLDVDENFNFNLVKGMGSRMRKGDFGILVEIQIWGNWDLYRY